MRVIHKLSTSYPQAFVMLPLLKLELSTVSTPPTTSSYKKKKKQHRGLSVISQNSCRNSLVLTNLAWGVVTDVYTYSDRSVYTPNLH